MYKDRKEHRYSTYLMNPERAYIDIDAGIKIRGRITDLSAAGLSFEISGSQAEIQAVSSTRDYFIEIVIGSVRIISGVQRVWGIVKSAETGDIYISGVKFEILSGEDRLRLYSIIEKIREMTPPA